MRALEKSSGWVGSPHDLDHDATALIDFLDAILRSLLYAHFAESLAGLPTIRSYGETSRFLSDNEYYIDLEDRANFLVSTNQRWLAIRLDFLGGLMVFVVRSAFSY